VVPPGDPHRGGLAVGLPAGFFIWVILRYPPLTPGVPRFNHAGLALFKKINLECTLHTNWALPAIPYNKRKLVLWLTRGLGFKNINFEGFFSWKEVQKTIFGRQWPRLRHNFGYNVLASLEGGAMIPEAMAPKKANRF